MTLEDPDRSRSFLRVGMLDTDDRVGALGHRRSRHDADRLARTQSLSALLAGTDLSRDPEYRRRVGSGARDVGSADRVPVHGAVVPGRERGRGDHRPG